MGLYRLNNEFIEHFELLVVFDCKNLPLLFRFWFVSLDLAGCVWLGQRQ